MKYSTPYGDVPKRNPSEPRSDFVNRCVSDPILRQALTYSERLEYAKANMDKVEESQDQGELEKYKFETQEEAKESARELGLEMIHSHETETGVFLWMPGKDMSELRQVLYFNFLAQKDCEGCSCCEQDSEPLTRSKASALLDNTYIDIGLEEEFVIFLSEETFLSVSKESSIEYASSGPDDSEGVPLLVKIPLNKPFKTEGGTKPFSVYTRGQDGLLMVHFGAVGDKEEFRKSHKLENLTMDTSLFWSDKMCNKYI